MRCAPLHALPSNSSLLPLLGIVFGVGALLFVLGTWMVRREAQSQTPVERSESKDMVRQAHHDDADVILNDPSVILNDPSVILNDPSVILSLSKEQLQHIVDHDPDERVRDLAREALIVIGARG